jgi:hypothetical protein
MIVSLYRRSRMESPAMPDLLCIYVLWHPQSDACGAYAEAISRHFDGLGMERDGVQYRIPVRLRSVGWDGSVALPRAIELDRAQHNAIVFLHDELTQIDSNVWDPYLDGMLAERSARGARDCIISFQMSAGASPLPSLAGRNINSARQYRWETMLPDQPGRTNRLLLHMLYCLRAHFRAIDGITTPEPLFVSHAKMDGDGTARAIIDHLNDTGQDVPLHTFYDAKELLPGEDFQRRFEREITQGTLLAIVSDLYDTRPWCIYELTTAKRARRPIVLADVGRVRTSRSYPYGANLPRVRLGAVDAGMIEALLVETLSEGLRCDLFMREAKALLKARGLTGHALPRPPELFDLVDADDLPAILVYPEPPVGNIEQEILERALRQRGGGRTLVTLGRLALDEPVNTEPVALELSNMTVALSIGNAADMARLGYPQREVDRALFSICGSLVRAGARLAYGGNLDPAGYTFKIFHFLAKAYAVRRQVPPFIHFVPASELRQTRLEELTIALREGSGIVEMRAVAADGTTCMVFALQGQATVRRADGGILKLANQGELEAWAMGLAGGTDAAALTAMRALVSKECPVRIVMGGRTGVLDLAGDRYAGTMPGVAEETLMTLQAGHLPVVLGAFGGAGRDIAIALDLLPETARVPRGKQAESYAPALQQIAELRDRLPAELLPMLRSLAEMDQSELIGHRIAALCAAIPPLV